MREIFITGAAAVTPLGRDLETTAARLAAGESGIVEVPVSEGGDRKGAAYAARIGAFTTEPEMPKAKARRLDRASQFAVVAVTRGLAEAGWTMAGNEEETGILLGTGSAGASPLVELERQMAVESPEAASPFLFPCTVANAPASIAAIELKIKGPNVTITQKDPAGLNALFYGRLLIADERAKAIVEVLTSFDRFLGRLMAGMDGSRELLLLVSDHGNTESPETRGHTTHAVPFAAWGCGAAEARRGMRSIVQVTPRVLEMLVPRRPA